MDKLLQSVQRSKLAYLGPRLFSAVWQNTYQNPKKNIPIYINTSEDLQAYIFTDTDKNNDKHIQVAFRGSSLPQDFYTDLYLYFKTLDNDQNVKVHEGFLQQFQSVESILSKTIEQSTPKTITFTGHSLGGGIAQIAALHFGQRWKDNKLSCHTFGCPRTGNCVNLSI